VLIDPSKQVSHIGEKFPIPIEVLPFAWQLVKRQIETLGGLGEMRLNPSKDGLAVTSHGSLVLDAQFNNIDVGTLNQQLNEIPGVVEHGIFYNLATKIFCGNQGIVQENI
jgi:ribose 5-phosphate isomerase A